MFFISRIIKNPKELILSSAKEIAHKEGLAAISMRKVATKSQIALGTIYNYYPTKMDIIIAIIEEFWSGCFKNFSLKENVDFFYELEFFYFYILDYLEQFESNWLKELSSFSVDNKIKGKEKEAEFFNNFNIMFERLIDKHMNEFSDNVFNNFSKDELVKFIGDYFFIMLKRYEHNYTFFNYALKKILL